MQQRLSLSPQLVQSIKLMGMPFAELRERILEEVDKNPALEIVSDPFAAESLSPRPPEARGLRVSSRSANEIASDEHRDFIEGALSREETLQGHLLSQLSELSLPPEVAALSALVIQNLDGDGFNAAPPEELPGGDDPVLLQEALDTVRSLDPAGCAVSGFQESLAVQARLVLRDCRELHSREPLGGPASLCPKAIGHAAEILERRIDLLSKGRPEALVKALAKDDSLGFTVDLEEAEEIFDLIRHLDPFPGRRFSQESERFVVPDVIVRRTEDGYSVTINEEEIPVLGVSPFFMELEGASDRESRDFSREAVKEARWFMNSLSRRNHTILKLARALVVFQRDFFTYGPARLAPLRMKDIAAEIGMHEATVSRAANGKYLQCEWGIFEIKYFFSNQVGSAVSSRSDSYTSARFSKEGVKETVRQIIEASPEALSDQKIVEQLALRGIKIARRTVAKYRGELAIKSSFER